VGKHSNKRYAVRITRDDDNVVYEIVGWGVSVVLFDGKTKREIVVSNDDFARNYKEVVR
jgi:hypothetical protein